MTRKEKAVLRAVCLLLIFCLLILGCSQEAGKPKETPIQKAERLLLRGDAASLQEARLALQDALKGDPQAAKAHFLLGTVYGQEAKKEASRDKSEETYNLAMAELEKALELHGPTGVPVELYKQLIDVCYERASLPGRFHQEKDLKLGVGPWEVKAMEKAIRTVSEGHARFPNDPAFSAEKGQALQKELAALKTLYTENVHRAWSTRPGGYLPPEEYKKVH